MSLKPKKHQLYDCLDKCALASPRPGPGSYTDYDRCIELGMRSSSVYNSRGVLHEHFGRLSQAMVGSLPCALEGPLP